MHTEYLASIVRRLCNALRRRLFNHMIVSRDYREEVVLIERAIRARYNSDMLDDEFWAAMIRKYAHIIDKGLQRCDSEPGHSSTYYKLLMDCFLHIKNNEMLLDASIIWARSKIEAFDQLQSNKQHQSNSVPYQGTKCHASDILEILRTRRSIRIFKEQAVPRDVISQIAAASVWAPSSCNRQATKIFVTDVPEIIKICIDMNDGATCFGERIPCFFSFCVDLRPYDMPKELTLSVIDSALGIQNCCLVAHSFGVGMTILNWTHHSREQDLRLRGLLRIPSYYRIVANAVLGYPRQGAPIVARKAEELCYVFVEGEIES